MARIAIIAALSALIAGCQTLLPPPGHFAWWHEPSRALCEKGSPTYGEPAPSEAEQARKQAAQPKAVTDLDPCAERLFCIDHLGHDVSPLFCEAEDSRTTIEPAI